MNLSNAISYSITSKVKQDVMSASFNCLTGPFHYCFQHAVLNFPSSLSIVYAGLFLII